ncbi:MAG: hypothetical protein ACFB10_02820 [Salibacteraceae bacterium]
MIVINDTVYETSKDLPKRYRDLLKFIKDGEAWFEWATTSGAVFEGTNFRQFFYRISKGLHETTLVKFPFTQLDLGVLMHLSDFELEDLKKHQKESPLPTTVKEMLEQKELKTYEDLKPIDAWLKSMGLKDEFWTNGLSFSDRLELLKLQKEHSKFGSGLETIFKEAVQFANDNSVTCTEFVSLCRFAIELMKGKEKLSIQQLKDLYLKLNVVANALIFSVQIGYYFPGEISFEELLAAIAQVNYVGFGNRAAALYHMALNFPEELQDPDKLKVEKLQQQMLGQLRRVHTELVTGVLAATQVAQDGSGIRLEVANSLFNASLFLSANGRVIMLPQAIQFKQAQTL